VTTDSPRHGSLHWFCARLALWQLWNGRRPLHRDLRNQHREHS
jgi:hypothetical protein